MTLFQPSLLLHYLLNGQFFSAAMTTLWLSVASLATGVCVGLLLAVGQEASARPVRLLVLAPISGCSAARRCCCNSCSHSTSCRHSASSCRVRPARSWRWG
ncbi:MAG: hypothetical protein WDN49_24960 [Acetobacteraceae bacterium]